MPVARKDHAPAVRFTRTESGFFRFEKEETRTMKPRHFVLGALLGATALVGGCGEDTITPDTTPPLAPVIEGATIDHEVVGIWWAPNTEPDLAGYNVYLTQNGQTWLTTSQPIVDNYISMHVENGDAPIYVNVSAVDLSENESSLSATERAVTPQDQDQHQTADDQVNQSTLE
jgi:hypothetical protein